MHKSGPLPHFSGPAYRLASRLDAMDAQQTPKIYLLYGGMRKFKQVMIDLPNGVGPTPNDRKL